MTFHDIDMNISGETKAILQEVKKFGMEVMRPAGIQLDNLHDPGDVIAKDSVLWSVFKGFRELGLHTMQIPKACGGMAEENDPMAAVEIPEQLGYADAGLAISMGVSCMPFIMPPCFRSPKCRSLPGISALIKKEA